MANTGGLGGGLSYNIPKSPKPRSSSRVIAGAGGIDARAFKGLSKALKEAEPELRLALLRNLKVIGQKVAKDAALIAGDFSETIPPTIKSQVRGEAVSIRAGGGTVHIAGLFELGNKGGKKSEAASKSGVFRHPVWGTDTWVDQPMHKFLHPALNKNRPEVIAAAKEALGGSIKIINDVTNSYG